MSSPGSLMVAGAFFTAPPNGDYTYRKLVERVVSGYTDAWREFVERFSNLLFSLIWRYANGDEDQCANLYLFVIEGLHKSSESGESYYRLRRYLESVDRYQGQGRLTTWLGKVTQNLVSDYFREQKGRRTLPRNIQRLDMISQEIFKILYWDCLSERNAFETLNCKHRKLSREEFDRRVIRINNCLKTCNRWSIYSEIIRRLPALPLHPTTTNRLENEAEVQVADPAPSASPSCSVISRKQQEAAVAMGSVLRRIIQELDQESRLMLVCRFKHGMTAGQIASLLRRIDEKPIYSELERLKSFLKDSLEREGFGWNIVEGNLEAIEGLLDEFDTPGKTKTAERQL